MRLVRQTSSFIQRVIAKRRLKSGVLSVVVDNLFLVEGWKVVELEDVADAEQGTIEEVLLDAACLELFYLVLVLLF